MIFPNAIRQRLRQAAMISLTLVMLAVPILFVGENAVFAAVSQPFDLTDSEDELFTKKALTDRTVHQSFAIDSQNEHVYTLQIMASGQRVGEETRTYTSAERTIKGDLTVTKMSLKGKILGKMYLIGFGQGTSLGVEPVGTSAYLWTEVDAVIDPSEPDGGLKGYGTKIGRFEFVNNQVLVNTDSSITKYSPINDADRLAANIDADNGLLTMRYRTVSGGNYSYHYSSYHLSQFKAGAFTPIATVDQPSSLGTFSGFTSYGDYLYLLDGNAYNATTNPAGNTYIAVVNFLTGAQVKRMLTNAGTSLLFREPHGMSIHNTGTAIRLCFGFASNVSPNNTNKHSSIFYKDALNSDMFELEHESGSVFTEKPLTDRTLQQSFAIDSINEHVYMVQIMAPGQQVGSEPRTYTSAERALKGDLTLTKLSLTGEILGKMHLIGFGHGVSIGVEPVNTTAYLWTEVDAATDSSDTLNGYGTKLARFPFINDQVLVNTDPSLVKYAPVAGADRTTVNIDMAHGLLTMRYRIGEPGSRVMKFNTYRLADVKAGNFTPLTTVNQPSGMGTFQGFASYGNYLYLLDGNPYDATTNPTGNTYLTTVNLNTNSQVARTITDAGSSLLFREPEGMSIQIAGSSARLCFGFGSFKSATNTEKNANIFYKDLIIQGN
ncbi:phage baseplate protein [Paenibacillus dakarensis]|uniref:phage baseplate protein n=1 Tax=Paenibacillus dakarensis TaxID=1527293 RepID=UPI0006D56243|nr:hypothetical protein [Paenibacillus dakarensis]